MVLTPGQAKPPGVQATVPPNQAHQKLNQQRTPKAFRVPKKTYPEELALDAAEKLLWAVRDKEIAHALACIKAKATEKLHMSAQSRLATARAKSGLE